MWNLVFLIELHEAIDELSEVECIDLLSWTSMQSLEEKEHEIRIMTENVSRFVRLIVKECVNRNPVRVWS